MAEQYSTPHEIAKAGEEIYKAQFGEELEKTHPGEFVAIDVLGKQAYVAPFPEEALAKARAAAPDGMFHLIKIGSVGAFKVSYTSDGFHSWLT